MEDIKLSPDEWALLTTYRQKMTQVNWFNRGIETAAQRIIAIAEEVDINSQSGKMYAGLAENIRKSKLATPCVEIKG